MCFSAEASYTASAVLAGIGVCSLRAAKTKPYILLAAVPLLFAVQQAAEGTLWLTLRGIVNEPAIALAAQYIFLFFAYLFWPVVFPLALFLAEKVNWRRVSIASFVALGVLWTAFMLYQYPGAKITPQVIGQSIQYVGEGDLQLKLVYGAIIIVPCFLSGLKFIRPFGLLVLASFIVSELFYQYAFTSVWCFFSAIISCLIYKIVKENQHEENALLQEERIRKH